MSVMHRLPSRVRVGDHDAPQFVADYVGLDYAGLSTVRRARFDETVRAACKDYIAEVGLCAPDGVVRAARTVMEGVWERAAEEAGS